MPYHSTTSPLPKPYQIRMVHGSKDYDFWEGRLVYGICLWERPNSQREIQRLTGFDRNKHLPRLLAALQGLNLLDGLRAIPSSIFPICKTGEPAYTWVGVRAKGCPLSPFVNALYWTYWGLSQQQRAKTCPAGYAGLLGVSRSSVKSGFAALEKAGGIRPPEEVSQWWEE
ncbi:unnamed protein product [Gemmata massiliana]|uniref:Uncharacterized protein n=1 Tax=Gemmata massiliana TaxID=1210884 RepID=A0A6P2D157_9BACT|nr:unnamed protein product [Gemmata massiliana]